MRKRRGKEVAREKRPQPESRASAESAVIAVGPHRIEEEVRRALLGQPGLQFSSLVVRRIPGGVCLEGVLEVDESLPDIGGLARRVAGVEAVLNHLVVRCPAENKPALKG